jgi:GPH family glycoside/pentoside/hexuronide:cation symporter
LIRKLTGSGVIFVTLQILGWSGYVTPPEGVTQFTQPDAALFMIRLMVTFIGAAIVSGTILLAWSYPLTREKYDRIKRLLAVRRNKNVENT